MNSHSFWLALALVFVLEGLMPVLAPLRWRKLFEQILALNDGQIRFFGFCSMAAGGAALALLTW
ncbi:MAG: hypothetical protein JWP47_675 [Polaromonas sp.]|nr:hypothetical protein [Polaromonas sp.]